jgi:hypothetical protein
MFILLLDALKEVVNRVPVNAEGEKAIVLAMKAMTTRRIRFIILRGRSRQGKMNWAMDNT